MQSILNEINCVWVPAVLGSEFSKGFRSMSLGISECKLTSWHQTILYNCILVQNTLLLGKLCWNALHPSFLRSLTSQVLVTLSNEFLFFLEDKHTYVMWSVLLPAHFIGKLLAKSEK